MEKKKLKNVGMWTSSATNPFISPTKIKHNISKVVALGKHVGHNINRRIYSRTFKDVNEQAGIVTACVVLAIINKDQL